VEDQDADVEDAAVEDMDDSGPSDAPDVEEEPFEIPDAVMEVPADAYGIVNVSFSTPYILDGSRLNDTAYVQSHGDGISGATFIGTYSIGYPIPGAYAGRNQTLALHLAGGSSSMVAVLQQSSEDSSGAIPANPWIELDFMDDYISTGEYEIDTGNGAEVTLSVVNIYSGNDVCFLAIGIGGAITVTRAWNTSAIEGGKLAFSGTGIPLYHPTMTPYGDMTAAIIGAGYQICPPE
ncbi:MAG: hypothetical protein ABIJ56_20270, partial [Pseudomonadota bacterium]